MTNDELKKYQTAAINKHDGGSANFNLDEIHIERIIKAAESILTDRPIEAGEWSREYVEDELKKFVGSAN